MAKVNRCGLIMLGSAVVAVLLVAVLLFNKGDDTASGMPSSAEVAAKVFPIARHVVAPPAPVAAPAPEVKPAPVKKVATPKPAPAKPKTVVTAKAAPKPVAKPKPAAKPAPKPVANLRGEELYDTVCFMCHGTGAAGAPLMGDAKAWAPRIARGEAALLKSATDGMAGMPPKGTCGECTAEDLKAAIAYMVDNSR